MGPNQRAALKEAFSLAASSRGEPEDWLNSTTPQKWKFKTNEIMSRRYEWCGDEGAQPFRV